MNRSSIFNVLEYYELQNQQYSYVKTAIMPAPNTSAFKQPKVGAVQGVAPYADDNHHGRDTVESTAVIGFSFKYTQDADSPTTL